MKTDAYREYRFRFYLNASHYVVFNGKKGQLHPHTWEFAITILIHRNHLIIFNQMESAVNAFIDQYQNKVMNEMEPFDHINPTLENITDYLAVELEKIAASFQTSLVRIEGSETPSRTYIVDLSDQVQYDTQSIDMNQLLDEMIRNGLKDAEDPEK